jgi:hypothetical protein
MGEIYDSNLIQEYKIERIKLIKQLKNWNEIEKK